MWEILLLVVPVCLLVVTDCFFQVNGVLPILPLLFPVLWILATAFGEARVLAQMSKASSTSLVGFSPHQTIAETRAGDERFYEVTTLNSADVST